MTHFPFRRSCPSFTLPCCSLALVFVFACGSEPEGGQITDAGQIGGTADASLVDAAPSDAVPADASQPPADASTPPAPERLLYLADQVTDGVFELFIASTNGVTTSSHRVNDALSAGMRVRDFATNDDGTILIYSAKTSELFDALELFAVDISDVDLVGTPPGSPVRLHGDLPVVEGTPSGGVSRIAWVPGRNQVIFSAALESFSEGDIYLANLGASGWETPVRLNASFPQGLAVQDFVIAPDGSGLLYRGPQETPAVDELYWVDLSGLTPGAPIRLSGPFPSGDRDVIPLSEEGYGFSPDASKVFYIADQNNDNVEELFIVRFTAGVPNAQVQVNGALASGGDVRTARWSPDSQWLAYRAQESPQLTESLYVAKTSGQSIGAGQLVSSGLYPGAEALPEAVVWAPDGSGFVFHATQLETGGQVVELFYVDVTGADPAPAVKLNGSLTSGGAVEIGGSEFQTLQWAPDASHLVYASSEDIANTIELFLVRFGAGGPQASQVISAPLPFPASDVTASLTPIAPDGSNVLFRANRDSSVHEVFLVDLSTSPLGPVTKVNSPMTLGGEAHFAAADDRSIQWSLEGRLIAYLADQEQNEDVEVFVVRANELGISVRGSGPLIAGGDVLKFQWVK